MGLCLTNGFPLEFYQSLLNLRRNCKRLNIQCSVFEQDALVLPLKMGGFRICMVLKLCMFLSICNGVIYFLIAVLAYLCGIKTSQVFTVLIAVTLVGLW